MISVILPTRGRPFGASRSVASLGDAPIETLIYVDNDDPDLDLYESGSWYDHRITGDRVGYKQMHLMVNQLCELASGDWLMLWNDDAVMLTQEWWKQVEDYDPNEPWVLAPGEWQDMNLFPLVSRKLYELLGHFSLSPHNDTWMQDLGREAGVYRVLDIEVRHDGGEGEFDDDTWAGRTEALRTTSAAFYGPEMTALRSQDTQKVKAWLDGI